MPLTVRLEKEGGSDVERVFDTQDVLTSSIVDEIMPALAIAHTIDPYGDTMLNRLQMPLFLKDLELLLERAKSASEVQTLREVERLVRNGLKGPHLYVRFVGD